MAATPDSKLRKKDRNHTEPTPWKDIQNHTHLREDYIPLPDVASDQMFSDSQSTQEVLCLHRAQIDGLRRKRHENIECRKLLDQIQVQRELTRVRRAACHTHPHHIGACSLSGNNDNFLEDFNLPIHVTGALYTLEQDIAKNCLSLFTGQIIIRPQFDAIVYALDEYTTRGVTPGRMALWVDGSTSSKGVSGTAVAYKPNASVTKSEWFVKAYAVLEFDRLGNNNTETLAIMQALLFALSKVVHNDGTDAKVSLVAIFSDCVSALRGIETFNGGNQQENETLLAKIAALASELKAYNVIVQLHWVPGHKGVPGNVLADIMAKRATKGKTLQ